jgi:hypothetical protein
VSTTRLSCLLLPAVAVLLLGLSGCEEKTVGRPHVHHPGLEIALCGKCGDVKTDGSHTCKKGATICPICGLHKGSILCCSTAINGRRDVVLCRVCGEKLFTSKCCKEGFAACPKCGLHKGSPGCCKITKATDEERAEAKKQAEEEGHAG